MKMLILALFISISAFAQEEQPPKLVGATLIGSKPFEVYQTDQELIYRKRTPPTPPKHESPTFENILDRQTMHEIGFGMTFFRASDGTLTRPEQKGLEVHNQHFVPGMTLRYNFHPSQERFQRFTFGAETNIVFSRATDYHNISNDGTAYNAPSMSPAKNWAALAEYDLIVIPWFQKSRGAFVLSSGCALGHQGTSQNDGPDLPISKGVLENFATFRLRTLSLRSMDAEWNGNENDKRSTGWSYIAFRISNKGTWKIDMGYVMGFGRSANSKPVVEK